MKRIASSSGVVISEDQHLLYLSKGPASWTATFLFVCALLTIILLFNGVIQLYLANKEQRSVTVGVILIISSAVFYLLYLGVHHLRKRKNAIPLNQLPVIAIFDFKNNTLLDGQHRMLTPISDARLLHKLQLSSSSPELIIQWPTGSISLVKGNPFSGGIGRIEEVLLAKGIKK